MVADFEKKIGVMARYLAYFLLFCLAFGFILPFVLFIIAIISRSGEFTLVVIFGTLLVLAGYMILAMIWYIASRITISIVKYPLYITVLLLSFPILDFQNDEYFGSATLFIPLWILLYWYFSSPAGETHVYFQGLLQDQRPLDITLINYYFIFGLVALIFVCLLTVYYLWPKASKVENIYRRRMYQVMLIYTAFPMIDVREQSVLTTILMPFLSCALALKLDLMCFMLYPLAFYISIAWISLYVNAGKAS